MNLRHTLLPGMLLLIYLWFCWLMLRITLQYIPLDTDVAFLRIKQDYIGFTYYKVAFFIHAYTAILVLPAGFTQFSKGIRRRMPAVHRTGGWIYVGITLLLAAPSGLVIGIHANGGILSQVAFCSLAVLWFYFTLQAVRKIRQKDFHGHQKFMIRSFALTLSAITLRAWKFIIVWAFHPPPMDVYRIVAWLGWTINLIIAEIIILKYLKK